ncbi:MAG: hypothetical protein DCC88_08090 [Spirobacillus cienkowskii]|uniref:Lipoprotein n=1 Tax=Spirobacillus cienkowskii TaxID=495820 RepID=A0A369KQK2_9BACT|nr:MAG: hypothetical protein DCC88_08090 [Spirobacillus cienkowskii]
MRKIIFVLIFFILISCNKNTSEEGKQYLVFLGLPDKDVTLYKVIKKNESNNFFYPLLRLKTNSKLLLPVGDYLLANECSSYEFTNDGTTEKKVVLSKLSLMFANKSAENKKLNLSENTFNSLCNDPMNKQEHWYNNRSEFDVLPGQNTISISGRNVELNTQPTIFSDKKVSLWPVTLTSPNNTDSSKFFSLPTDLLSNEKRFVISSPVNGTLWLQKGRYQIEVNGTKRIIQVKDFSNYVINLGVMKISSPRNFPIEERLKAGGQPIFAYVNEKVLFRLNTNYPVFPGKYRVALEGTEIEKFVDVAENEITEVKTRGVQISSPICPKNEKCRSPSRITVHTNRMPFVLMTVMADMPFLVFDQKYEYGIEGIKGVFKNLVASEEAVKIDKLGRVKIKWETRYTTGNTKTDFVRFESKSPFIFGKSIDLMYFKPEEVYLPEGDYWLTYFVGDQSLVLPKTRVDVVLTGGSTREVVIPVYTQKLSDNQLTEKNRESTNFSTKTTLSPIRE